MNQHYSRMYGRSHQLATWLVKWARVEWKRCGVLHILEWNRCGTQNGMNIVKRYSYYTWTADSWTMYLYPRGAGHGLVLLRVRVAMNTSISHCYKYFYGHNFCSTAELMELRKICFMLAVVVSTIIADHQTPVTTAQPYVSDSVTYNLCWWWWW